MRRILYIGGFELPDKNAAAHRVLSIAKAWRDAGLEVVFMGVTKEDCERDVLKTKTEVQGFTAYSIPYPKKKSDWMGYLAGTESVERLIESYDAVDGVVCYNYQAIAFEKLRRYCKQRDIKIYSDCTEWYNTDGANLAFKLLKGFDTWYRMSVVQKKLDGMIVISNYLKNYYKKCKNVIVVPPLVDTKEEKWFIEAKDLGEGINFVYAGQPGNKDKIGEIYETYCGIAKKYKCKLWVVGISREQFIQGYTTGNEVDIPKTVIFLGRVSHKESLAYLKGADCSLIIRDSTRTNNAGFPTKFAEAVTLGVGVIATDISDLREYAGKIDNVFICGNSLYETMEDYVLKNNKEKRICDAFDYRNWEKILKNIFD